MLGCLLSTFRGNYSEKRLLLLHPRDLVLFEACHHDGNTVTFVQRTQFSLDVRQYREFLQKAEEVLANGITDSLATTLRIGLHFS